MSEFDRPDWDEYFLNLAEAVAVRADCTRRKVGAVLVHNNQVISTGYNGARSGESGCGTDSACPRGQLTYEEQPKDVGYSNCIAIHAEANAFKNAVNFGRTNLIAESTLYITHQPCTDCKVLIDYWGVKEVKWKL